MFRLAVYMLYMTTIVRVADGDVRKDFVAKALRNVANMGTEGEKMWNI